MKRKRLAKSVRAAVVILSGAFFLLGQDCGANSIGPSGRNNSANRSGQTSKPATRQARRNVADPSSFTPNMPFSEAVDILRHSTIPPLNIAVIWRDLEKNADIYRDTPIGMDGLSKVPLRTHLKLLLASVSGGSVEKLGYVVDEGVIIIATQGSLPKRMKTRVYDITDLVSEPANYRFMPGFGMPFGLGGMPFGGMMPFGGVGFGGRGFYGGGSPYNGAGLSTLVGRSLTGTVPNTGSYRYNNTTR